MLKLKHLKLTLLCIGIVGLLQSGGLIADTEIMSSANEVFPAYLEVHPNNFDQPQITTGLYASNGIWVGESDGNVPPNAVVYGHITKRNYYCRIQSNGVTFYGVLLPQTGCYIQKFGGVASLYQYYEVLVNG